MMRGGLGLKSLNSLRQALFDSTYVKSKTLFKLNKSFTSLIDLKKKKKNLIWKSRKYLFVVILIDLAQFFVLK